MVDSFQVAVKINLNNLQWQLLSVKVDSAFPLHTCLQEAWFPEH